MTKLKIAIFIYAYLKRSNSRSTCQNCKSKGLFFFCYKIPFQVTKKKSKFFLVKSRDQKYAEQKKLKKKNEFFTSPGDRMYTTVSGIIVFGNK